MSQLKDDLNAMADLLEQGWTQGADARDKDGFPTIARFEEACSWCIEGAAIKIGGSWARARPLLSALGLGFTTPSDWNDRPGRTQEEVIALVRKAAEEAA